MNISELFFKKRCKNDEHKQLIQEQELMKKVIEEQQTLICELEELNKVLNRSLKECTAPQQMTKHLCDRIDLLKFKNMQEKK